MPKSSSLCPNSIATSLLLTLPHLVEAGRCPGVCQDISLSCESAYRAGLCPGSLSVRCCPQETPSCASASQQCQSTSLPCTGGRFVSGKCPGDSSVKCCETGGGGGGGSAHILFTVDGVPVKQLDGDSAFFWSHSLQVDADGAPNAYSPNDKGIDYLANAGHPGNWWGIATDSGGRPYVQGSYPKGSHAPCPGFYVSTTSLEDRAYRSSDTRHYANAVELNFIVLPLSSAIRETGAHLGDIAFVYNTNNNKHAFAVYGDEGPGNKIGEGSVALHQALGSNPYNSAGTRVVRGIDSGVVVVVFPGSKIGSGTIPSQEKLTSSGEEVFDKWGGMDRFNKDVMGNL